MSKPCSKLCLAECQQRLQCHSCSMSVKLRSFLNKASKPSARSFCMHAKKGLQCQVLLAAYYVTCWLFLSFNT